jgi:hypothetical protein
MMFRTAFIALAFCLFCLILPVQAAGNKQEATRTDKTTAGTQQPPPVLNDNTHLTITCKLAVNGAPPGTIIPIPAGKNPTDLCPIGAITYHMSDTPYRLPIPPGAWPAPSAADETPATKTQPQQPSGQQPP